MSDIYQDNGYDSRQHYLECLAEDYGIDNETIVACAELLGPEEDFDGLISTLADCQ